MLRRECALSHWRRPGISRPNPATAAVWKNRCRQFKKNAIGQVLARRILTVCGEVAERLIVPVDGRRTPSCRGAAVSDANLEFAAQVRVRAAQRSLVRERVPGVERKLFAGLAASIREVATGDLCRLGESTE
jgi:hypothetical protein